MDIWGKIFALYSVVIIGNLMACKLKNTPSFARENLIYLQEIGKSEYLEPYISQREILPSYLIFLVKSGAGKLICHDVAYELKTESCILKITPFQLGMTYGRWIRFILMAQL